MHSNENSFCKNWPDTFGATRRHRPSRRLDFFRPLTTVNEQMILIDCVGRDRLQWEVYCSL